MGKRATAGLKIDISFNFMKVGMSDNEVSLKFGKCAQGSTGNRYQNGSKSNGT